MTTINKITKYTFLGLAFGTMLGSCDLDVTPTSNIASETFWQSEKDAWYNLNSIYSSSIPGVSPHADAYTPYAYCQYLHESKGSIFQQNGLHPGIDEGYNFETVRKQNLFLKEVESVPMDADLKERFKAEVRAMRAWTYLGLTMTFGKVPLITDVPEYNSPNVPRDEVGKVREFILTELEEASKILPPKYAGGYPNEKGRITKYAALAIKARAALYFGEYEIAEKTAEDIMKNGGFKLWRIEKLTKAQEKEAEQMDLFVDFNGDNDKKDKFIKGMFSYESIWHDESASVDNPEYIMTRQYTGAGWDYQDMVRYTSLRPNQLGGWSSVTPTQNLVDEYWTVDGKEPNIPSVDDRASFYNEMRKDVDAYIKAKQEEDKNNASQEEEEENKLTPFIAFTKEIYDNRKLKEYKYMEEFRNRDPRMYASILFPFKSWHETEISDEFYYEWMKIGNNESKTGFNFRKMVTLKNDSENNGQATSDCPCIRFAEILLIYAEARTQGTAGYDDNVEKALNALRDRCGMPNVPSGLGKEEALKLIARERNIELAGEGIISDDLNRYSDEYWNKRMNNVPITMPDGENIITMKWDTRMHLKPIPQTAIDFNPLLKNDQNPGY